MTVALAVVASVLAAPGAPARADGDTTSVASSLGDLPVDIRPDAIGRSTLPTTASPVAAVGAAEWHDAGFSGAGVKVGVIDYFDIDLYWDDAVLGARPVAGVNARCFQNGADCTDDFYDGTDRGGEQHGVAVVEMIRSVAPDAEIFIGQATTIADYAELVDWFAGRGVRIVSRSLGSRYDGPGDGRGLLGEIAALAVSKGITWFNSGGNNGRDNYYRHQVRLSGTDVAFGGEGTTTFLEADGCLSLAGVRWANDWDLPPSERTDYDVFIWESPPGSPAAGRIVSRSERRQTTGAAPLELTGSNLCPTPGQTLYIQVRWLGGDIAGDVLEILDYGDGFTDFTQAPYSAAVSIVDSDLAGVVAVGAIDPPDSGTIGFYSSQGPTNDGRVAPAVVAPSGFWSDVYDGVFSGTSAAAPVVAGAAALLLDAGFAGDASSLGDLVRNTTIDRGTPGPDNEYGYGEFRLPPAPPQPIASTPSRYVPLAAPMRALDTRQTSAVGPAELVGPTWAGEIRRLPIAGVNGVPTDATSVAVNLATVAPDRRSYVQALPLWQSMLGGYSNLNTDTAAQNRANFAIVPVADDGTIALYNTAVGHLVVDVLGWFEPVDGPVTDGRFTELPTPQRLIDTRTSGGPVTTGTTLAVPDPVGIPTDELAAVVVTVTAVQPSAVGWLQALPADRTDAIGSTSTVNTSPGTNAASTAIVPIGSAGLAVHADFGPGGSGHVVVDAIGYVTSPSAAASEAGRYVPVSPARAFDSRTTGGPLADGQTVLVSSAAATAVPTTATAVMWNLTVVAATRRGFATGWAADAVPPLTSVLNWSTASETRAAAAVTAVSSGSARFRFDDQGAPEDGPLGHFLADVFGYFT